jgi:hypothetical protein
MSATHSNYRARMTGRQGVVWGCDIHRAPAGTECRGCAAQGQLFSWGDLRPGLARHPH